MSGGDKDGIIFGLPSIAHILAQDDGVLVLQSYSDLCDPKPRSGAQSSQWQSPPPAPSYGGFNLGLHVGDNPEQVHQHRSQLLAAINHHLNEQGKAPLKKLHWLNQVHGNTVINIDQQPPAMQPCDADAMVSKHAQSGLAIMTADCVPIVLYQPLSGQIAAIHAGWQGLANGVIAETVKTFSKRSTDPGSEIWAWLGACISQSSYEVGADVIDKLMSGCASRQGLTKAEITKLKAAICKRADKTYNNTGQSAGQSDKYWLDLPKLARLQLAAQGIDLANDNPIPCSYEDSRYYSYRQQTHEGRAATGRMALVIVRL